ncbi:MAG TPA: S9 family peptidase, partial [Phycisphaerales bacterium]|nr:S9 family peptidase [Phycisphaerales bacterium]
GKTIGRRALSPSGRWMLLSVADDPGDSKRDTMPAYINEDGYVSTRTVRPKVGQEKRRDDSLVLLDLVGEQQYTLDTSALPMITDDPLAWLKDKNTPSDEERDDEEESPAATTDGAIPDGSTADHANDEPADEPDDASPRPFTVESIAWNPDGTRVAAMLRSNDNKDRWIVTVDLASGDDAEPSLVPVHHLRDEAWINWRYNEFGWTRDGSTLWYLSEETGYGHLYAWDADTGETKPLTAGRFTVRDVAESPAGGVLYYRANREDPGVYELERVGVESGETEKITTMGGTVESYALSPDGSRVLVTFSTAMDPPELYVLDAAPGAAPARLTHTDTDLFRSFDWIAPEFVRVPSTHGAGPIPCRVYEDTTIPAGTRGKPVVLFSHGAGYTQHVYNGWSYYFREHLFHTLLARKGYIVIAPDFRASAGYGRDWRTAIYRRMGTPELEDFDDCLAWLGETRGADLSRVGIYGGSYGGFMTLMAMFNRPGVYRCGAALRPVTDWAHYNHGYTSNILNTPEIDPEAFERSSPIEHADGLAGALLMCHGLVDDNVVAQDTIRLAQRLIELKKENWEMMLYPVEPHGFREPESWLDEYRRILKLFETNLNGG